MYNKVMNHKDINLLLYIGHLHNLYDVATYNTCISILR